MPVSVVTFALPKRWACKFEVATSLGQTKSKFQQAYDC